ncbi:succinylglutamate desuccinylase/aspartoacylase family protein [Pseudomonas sp. N040]|uniref:succinylglutamate desuccinylase/aspartoacylase family protein n=1 Tax=Pseudomonas sp. N040 TaxID=2785325 RepID=UPI0018A291CB|nr:succinylglutamate desuccinylase/aspartoacylase family protein [Pseudomonas sp. N040]MBF7731521.1 succinylglutamate desuccinylase/aspartoacylase family protein [Pseudomonas sp. N040]MBW7015165.1 succinylglutamate desuccinylase/aspartoacylase family protein [Pseudomonas sp. N040]
MHRIDHQLPWNCLGTQRTLTVFSFGAGERKAYIQASLHADELPGMRVAVALKRRLRELEQAGQLLGVIELVPVANPVGLAQMFQGTQQGRFEFASGKNFNRDFVRLDRLIGDQLEGQLQQDATVNLQLIRQKMRVALDTLPPAGSELQGLQRLLLRHACDADVVLDLHCDFEAAVHLYSIPQHWPAWQALAARMQAAAVLLAEDSGGGSFDEVCSAAWLNLARRFADYPVPLGCMATALELGGMADTDAERTEAQAEAILGFLADCGLLAGNWPPAPVDCCAATPFDGAQYAVAPHAGVVSFVRAAGARVEPGDPLFEVYDPLDDRHSVVRAETAGVIYARERLRFAQPGLWLAKVAGATPIRQGRLLSD